jgi:transposase
MDIIENRYRMIIEPEHSGKTISDVCIAFGVSRETWYKWKRRSDAYGIDGLKDQSRRPHNIKNVKVTQELEKLALELRLNNRFGPMRRRLKISSRGGGVRARGSIYGNKFHTRRVRRLPRQNNRQKESIIEHAKNELKNSRNALWIS